MGRVFLTTPIWGWFVIPKLMLDMTYLYTKLENSSSTLSKDMTGSPKLRNASHDSDDAIRGNI